MKYDKDQVAAANENLKDLRPGDTVYTVVSHRARSNESRSIQLFRVQKGEIKEITWSVSRVLDYPIDQNNGGIKVGGCGMDMCFHVVYSLGRKLFPKGFTRRAGKSYGRDGDPGSKDLSGGYALNHRNL